MYGFNMENEIKDMKREIEVLKRAVEEIKLTMDIEPEVRPEYLERLRKISKGKHIPFKDIDDLRRQIEG